MSNQRSAISIQQCTIDETADDRALRYERTLRAIAKCELTGVEFGDYVQALCDDVLAGGEPECWQCGTAVHDGPCVSEYSEE